MISPYSEANIKEAICSAIRDAKSRGEKEISSLSIIAYLFQTDSYQKDEEIPVGESINAKLGKDIKAVGEVNGLLKEIGPIYNPMVGTSGTNYLIARRR